MPLRAPCAQVAKPVSSRDVPPRRIEPQPSPEPMVATPVWAVLPLGPNGASWAVAVTTDAMRRSADTIAFGAVSADEELCQTPRERGTVQAAGAQVGGGPMTYCKPDLEDAGLAAGRATGSRRALVTGVVGMMRCTEPVKAVPARGLGVHAVHGEQCAPRFGPEQGTHCWGGITAAAWIGQLIWRAICAFWTAGRARRKPKRHRRTPIQVNVGEGVRARRKPTANHRRPPSQPTRAGGAGFRLLSFLVSLPVAVAPTAFSDKSSLQGAIAAWCGNPTSAEAAHGHISAWDASAVTDMSGLGDPYSVPEWTSFFFCPGTFNEPIGSWDVARVTNMEYMFFVSPGRCPIGPPHTRFPPCVQPPPLHPRTPEHSSPPPLHTWQSASSFNQPLDWDVGRVTSMKYMFTVSPGRCPIAPPHTHFRPCVQPAASAPTRA